MNDDIDDRPDEPDDEHEPERGADDRSPSPSDGDGGDERAGADDSGAGDIPVEPDSDGPGADEDRAGPVNGAEADEDDEDDGHWLTSLLSALESIESGSTSGRRRGDRTVVDYDVSIGTVTDDDSAAESPFGSDRVGDEPADERRRTRRYRSSSSSSSSDALVTERVEDDELQVTADVAGIDPEEVTVGFDGSMLVVGVSGRELDRVEVPWPEREAEATINNGVLTVQVTPGPEADSDE